MESRCKLYQFTVRLFLGERARVADGEEANLTHRRRRLRALCTSIHKRIMDLDTTEHHRSMLLSEVGFLSDRLKQRSPDPWILIYILFRLVGRLLGQDFRKGARTHTPVYFQTLNQWVTTEILNGGDPMADYYAERNAVAVRRRIAEQLIDEGKSKLEVALVLNVSEYEIKKLLAGA